MSAPKKIWLDKDYLTVGFQAVDDRDIPYISADIVDELVEALKEVVDLSDDPVEWFEWRDRAMPALSAPSPITATTRLRSPCKRAPMAMPKAAEMLVEECAVPKASNSLSSRRGKPDKPFFLRKVGIRSPRPVRILWG